MHDDVAIAAYNMLSNGMGGIDWSGLDLAVERFEIEDVEGLIDRLVTIKNHQPPEDLHDEPVRDA